MTAKSTPYVGINAHLNSFLQQPDGGWEAFHARHISDLATALDENLPDHYYAVEEKSLQINAYDPTLSTTERRIRTTPDVTVYQTEHRPSSIESASTFTPTLTFPVTETFSDEDSLNSVMVYRVADGKIPGIPVMRVEVLSPANKPHGTYYLQYVAKRQDTLMSGLRLLEIDYLHQSRPFLSQIPSYPDGDSGAYPYSIVVSNPYPSLADGQTQVYGFSIDSPLPTIALPLMDEETITLDFGVIYQRTVASRRLFSIVVDYTTLPLNFERYSDADQTKIRAILESYR